jgi:hypothetical protein
MSLELGGVWLVYQAQRRQPVPLPHQDPDVLTAVRAAVARHPSIAGLRIVSGEPGSDLQVQVTIVVGDAPGTAGEVIRLLGTEVMARLGGRLRRGIAVAVVPR